jgi:hypothetical protein
MKTKKVVTEDVKDVSQQDNKPVETTEPATQDIAVDKWEMEQEKIGKQAAEALALLTSIGVVEWEVGRIWARACLCVHVIKDGEATVVFERGEKPEDASIDDLQEIRQDFLVVDDGAYKNLMHHISRNWVYPEGC